MLAAQAELPAEIDVDAARQRLEDLRSAEAADDDDLVAKAEIAKANARIKLAG